MAFKINLAAKIDRAKLKKIVENKQKLIMANIKSVVKNEAIPHLIDLIMVGYDDLSARAAIGPDDPTNPQNWRAEFLAKLRKDLDDTLIVTRDRIVVRLGDKEFLGYNPTGTIDPDDTEPLHWLVFFIEGLAGDWGFVTPDTYQRITRGRYNPQWGRFSQGFMISREDYEEQGWSQVVPFDQVRHPFSGYAPVDIFREALNEFKIRPFIRKAIDAAVQGRRL